MGRSASQMDRRARTGRIPIVGITIVWVLPLVAVGVLSRVRSITLIGAGIGDRHVFVAGRKNQQEGGEND
jgi:hypothetical protein